MKISFKTTQCFVDSAGNKHESKLMYLLAERQLAMRGAIQSDVTYGKNSSFTASQVADIVIRQASDISDIARSFNAAINRERAKANVVQ
jgi:hypothetical protein